MEYKLRFIQKFSKADETAFLALEKKFAELEKVDGSLPVGKRYLPVFGKEASNTLIWEADFSTLDDAFSTLMKLENNTAHDDLLEEQIKYMTETYIEIYKTI
jgi:hypothetical protein